MPAEWEEHECCWMQWPTESFPTNATPSWSHFDLEKARIAWANVANAINNTLEKNITGVFNLHHKNFKIIEIADSIVKKIPSAKIETTPMKFQDSRNYQVSSEKLFKECGFKAEIELTSGINEVYDLIANSRIKNVNHKRYSNQNFLEEYGIK